MLDELGAQIIMDWKTFISTMAGSLIWPIVVATVLIIFRKQLSKILFDLKKIKYGPLEFEFAGKIKALKNEVNKGLASSRTQIDPNIEMLLRLTEMAYSDPKGAIHRASSEVDNTLIQVAGRHNVPAPAVKGIFEGVAALHNLEKKGVITKEMSELFERLLEIRNLDSGKASADKNLALDFVNSASRLIMYLRSI